MARDYQSERSNWRGDNERSNRWRDENEGRYGGDDRDYDYRYTRGDEGDSSVRAGSYDQGRVQYGRRDPREQRGRDVNEQSGSTSRYAGYGDFGQGNYGGGSRRDSGQERYGQSGYGGRDFGGNYGGDFREDSRGGEAGRRYGYESGYGRQGGYGGDFGRGRYGEGGSESRFERDADRDRGSDYFGYGYGGYGHGGQEYGARSAGLHRGKGPKGYQRSDERLQEMICERLSEDPDIDASEISVSVQGGRVTIEGTVDSRRTKNLAEDVAEQLGVNDVQNNLRVQRQDASGVQSSTLGTAQGTQARGGSTVDPSKSKQH